MDHKKRKIKKGKISLENWFYIKFKRNYYNLIILRLKFGRICIQMNRKCVFLKNESKHSMSKYNLPDKIILENLHYNIYEKIKVGNSDNKN